MILLSFSVADVPFTADGACAHCLVAQTTDDVVRGTDAFNGGGPSPFLLKILFLASSFSRCTITARCIFLSRSIISSPPLHVSSLRWISFLAGVCILAYAHVHVPLRRSRTHL